MPACLPSVACQERLRRAALPADTELVSALLSFGTRLARKQGAAAVPDGLLAAAASVANSAWSAMSAQVGATQADWPVPGCLMGRLSSCTRSTAEGWQPTD